METGEKYFFETEEDSTNSICLTRGEKFETE